MRTARGSEIGETGKTSTTDRRKKRCSKKRRRLMKNRRPQLRNMFLLIVTDNPETSVHSQLLDSTLVLLGLLVVADAYKENIVCVLLYGVGILLRSYLVDGALAVLIPLELDD